MTHNIEVEGGKTVKLPTAGKYCDRDILVSGRNNEADLQTKYDEGVAVGEHNGAAACAARHFVHNFVGDGTGSVSFRVPFEPDAIKIIGFDPRCHVTTYAAFEFTADLRAFGQLGGGVSYVTSEGSTTTSRYTTKSVLNRYSRTEDGVITIGNLNSSLPLVFPSGFAYTAIAVKYTEQTDKERITDFVKGLTGSGTVTLHQAKVNAAFPDDEWVALIATKPGWTFNWI
ncbi:MAG: hypothetical protein IJB75_02660 [Oscillospiraceae bacterium]|nr:hypothetical protein [Oscillospiraceae bacterium]